MKKLFFIACLFMICCQNDTKSKLYIDCSENCDSISVIENDGLFYKAKIFNGSEVGEFISVKNSDTIYGFNELTDNYYKKTSKYTNGTVTVGLYRPKNGRWRPTEFFQYEFDTIWKLASHFIHFESNNEFYDIFPNIGEFDSLLLKHSNKTILSFGQNEDIRIETQMLDTLKFDELLLFEFLKIQKFPDGSKTVRSNIIPISKERIIKNSLIEPHPKANRN